MLRRAGGKPMSRNLFSLAAYVSSKESGRNLLAWLRLLLFQQVQGNAADECLFVRLRAVPFWTSGDSGQLSRLNSAFDARERLTMPRRVDLIRPRSIDQIQCQRR